MVTRVSIMGIILFIVLFVLASTSNVFAGGIRLHGPYYYSIDVISQIRSSDQFKVFQEHNLTIIVSIAYSTGELGFNYKFLRIIEHAESSIMSETGVRASPDYTLDSYLQNTRWDASVSRHLFMADAYRSVDKVFVFYILDENITPNSGAAGSLVERAYSLVNSFLGGKGDLYVYFIIVNIPKPNYKPVPSRLITPIGKLIHEYCSDCTVSEGVGNIPVIIMQPSSKDEAIELFKNITSEDFLSEAYTPLKNIAEYMNTTMIELLIDATNPQPLVGHGGVNEGGSGEASGSSVSASTGMTGEPIVSMNKSANMDGNRTLVKTSGKTIVGNDYRLYVYVAILAVILVILFYVASRRL
jgi:hypothetical protein